LRTSGFLAVQRQKENQDAMTDFADVTVPLCVLILEAHKAAETGELQAVLREVHQKERRWNPLALWPRERIEALRKNPIVL